MCSFKTVSEWVGKLWQSYWIEHKAARPLVQTTPVLLINYLLKLWGTARALGFH